MTSAPRATPPVASNPSATRRAPAVIDIACSTFDFNRGGLSLFAGIDPYLRPLYDALHDM
jgi:hypothetical protein